MFGCHCCHYVIIMVTNTLLVLFNYVEGNPYVAVIGGEAYMGWNVSTCTEGTRYVYDPDNNTIIVFLDRQIQPDNTAGNVSYTGDIYQGNMSFTWYGITAANAGKYKYVLPGNFEDGGQDLVIAELPILAKFGKKVVKLRGNEEADYDNIINVCVVDIASNKDVIESPNITDITELSPPAVAGTNYALNCNAVSTSIPAAHNLTMLSEWKKNGTSIPLGSRYNVNGTILVINDLNSADGEDNFTCVAYEDPRKKSEESRGFILNVYYGPNSTLQLSPNNTSYTVVEYSTIPDINCTSPCFPSCSFQWTGPVVSSTGIISLGTVHRFKMGYYRCMGQNPWTNKTGSSDVVMVFVIYGPDTAVIDPSTTEYLLNESDVLPNIKCSADCFPNCTSRWYQGTTPVPGSLADTLSLGYVYRNKTGNYTCRSVNTESWVQRDKTLNVVVQYGPDNPLLLSPSNTIYRVVEHSTIHDINCTSPCFPSCDFQWTGPVVSSTGIISLGTVHRFMMGNYTCKAQNPWTNKTGSSDVVMVFVIYGPDTQVIDPSTTEYRLNESDVLSNIQCSADCFPNCTSRWYKGTTPVPGSPADTLSLGHVYRNETGNYTCRSLNTESRVEVTKMLTIVVQYPPIVTMESRNGTHGDTGFMLNCSAYGIPEQYAYKLTHSSLFSGSKIRQLNYASISTGVIVHQFTNLSYMDTGNYTCSVNNGIPDYRDGSLDKSVTSTVWIKGKPLSTSSEFTFYTGKGQSAKLVLEFYNSRLNAHVMWYRLKHDIPEYLQHSEKYKFTVSDVIVNVTFYAVNIQETGLMATLEIMDVTEEDFATYEVHVNNSVGEMPTVTLELRPRGKYASKMDNGGDAVIIGSVIGTVAVITVVFAGVLLYRRRKSKLNKDGKSSGQSKTCRSDTTDVTNMEGYTTINTVPSKGEVHYANVHLDRQDTAGKTNENVNTRSSDIGTYEPLTPYANNEDHAYSTLNQRAHQKGEEIVYENTEISARN